MKQWVGFMVLALLMAFVTACGNSGETENAEGSGDSSGSSNTEENSSDESSEDVSGKVIVGGSSALQPLAAAAAKQFSQENPEAQIDVQGGGSGTGLSEVSAGNFDIGNSDIFAEEKEDVSADDLVDHKVAIVGMTAAVNPNVGVKNLSKEDLIKVFTGKVENWKEVGGKDVKVKLVNRPEGSGTRTTFNKYALDGETPAEGITEDSSNTVKQIVADTDGAIGYLAFNYFDDSIVKLSIDDVKATEENVTSGEFPVWAYEHMYTKGEPDGVAKAFLDYVMSDDVQDKLVPEQGYIAATKMRVERDAEGKTSDK